MTAINNEHLWLWADWPAPKHIRAGTSLRTGGLSLTPYNELNLAHHVGDDVNAVNQNRKLLINHLGLKSEPAWLNQTHSTNIVSIEKSLQNRDADGVYTSNANAICTVMTADCVPILLCDRSATKIAAIHAGWKGICSGIIEAALQLYPAPEQVLIWIGPCISKTHYEVGHDVYSACTHHSSPLEQAFSKKDKEKWLCDLHGLVKIIAEQCGVGAIYECSLCTYEREDLFYSYRRDGNTGRTASMIWME